MAQSRAEQVKWKWDSFDGIRRRLEDEDGWEGSSAAVARTVCVLTSPTSRVSWVTSIESHGIRKGTGR